MKSHERALLRIEAALHLVVHRLDTISKELCLMSPALRALADQVAANKAVTDSAVLLIKGLSAQIANGADDAAAMAQLAMDLHVQAENLADAVAANTPPPAPPAPEPATSPAPDAADATTAPSA